MARPLRILFPGAFYHVFSRGNNRQRIFRAPADRQHFLELLATCCDQFRVRLYAYCLMPNHYHFFLETQEATLSACMRHLNAVYTQWFNRRYDCVGHLLQGRFKARLVQREVYGLELSRYIHLNPCRAGLAKDPAQFPWSSARYHLLGAAAPPPWLDVDWTLGQFGRTRHDAQAAYRRFLLEGLAQDAPDILEKPMGAVLGNHAFAEHIRVQWLEGKVDPEVSELRALTPRPSKERILAEVGKSYHQHPQTMQQRRRNHEARQVAMYLVRQLTGSTHRDTGAFFGGIGYTGVSQCIRRVEQRRRHEVSFERKLRRLEAALSVK